MLTGMKQVLSGKGLKSQLVRGGLGNLIIKVVYTLFAFGIGVLLARLMGATKYGVYSYIYAIIMVLAVPAQFGLPTLIVRETAQSFVKEEWGRINGLWQWGTRITAFLTVIITAGTFLFVTIAGDRIDQGYRSPLYWGLALLLLLALTALCGAALRGLGKIIRGQLPEQVLVPGFFILMLLVASFLFAQKISPSLAMMLQALAALWAFIISAILLQRSTPKETIRAKPAYEHKAWLSSSISLALISGMQVINKWVSLIILGLFVPSAQIGIYRVAVQMAVLADFGLQVVQPVVAPQIARLYTLGDQRRLQRLATNSARVTLLVNATITTGFLLLGRQFIRLFFGAEFSPAYPALLILLVGGVINSLTGAVAYFLNMTGYENETLRARLVSTFVCIILTFLLSPVWGILGAAVGSSIPLIIWNVMLWDLARKRLKVNSLAFGRDIV